MQQPASRRSELAEKFLLSHPDPNEWTETFSTSAQMALCDPQIPYGVLTSLSNDECPALGLFLDCYADIAIIWMEQHIDVINTVVQAQHRLSKEQVYILAHDIFTEFYHWNLADVCVFFGKARRGCFGHFYGSIDNMVLMEWMHEFDRTVRDERYSYFNKMEKIRKEKEIEERKKNGEYITLDAYLASLSEEERTASVLTDPNTITILKQIDNNED